MLILNQDSTELVEFKTVSRSGLVIWINGDIFGGVYDSEDDAKAVMGDIADAAGNVTDTYTKDDKWFYWMPSMKDVTDDNGFNGRCWY